MSDLSKPAHGPNKHKKDTNSDGVFPICHAGKDYCKRPDRLYQVFTSFCENCGKMCHEGCGELLDVPHKFFGDEPGFYCFKCMHILPRSLYPRMPSNGIPCNIPSYCDDGDLPFKEYMTNRMSSLSKEKAKKKKKRNNYSYPTRGSVTRVLRSHH
jgi:hypothetical protein